MKTIRIIFAITVMASILLGLIVVFYAATVEKHQYLWIVAGLCYSIIGATGVMIIIDGHFFKSRDELNKLIIRYRELKKGYEEGLTVIGRHEALKIKHQ